METLLVAEAPTSSEERYFYFEDVREHDALFRYVAKVALDAQPTRENKGQLLEELKRRGFFLIDLKLDPLDDTPLAEHVPGLVRRVRRLRPKRVILIKAPVYDAAFAALRDAGLPVVDERIPFPGSGQQPRFERAFGRALPGVRR